MWIFYSTGYILECVYLREKELCVDVCVREREEGASLIVCLDNVPAKNIQLVYFWPTYLQIIGTYFPRMKINKLFCKFNKAR